MKRLVPLIWIVLLAACSSSSSNPAPSPTAQVFPRLAKGDFCRDWTAAVVLREPLASFGGAEDAAALDQVAATFQDDARTIGATGDETTAERVTASAEAVSALADEVRSAPDPATDSSEEVDGAIAQLHGVMEDAGTPLVPMCVWFRQNELARP